MTMAAAASIVAAKKAADSTANKVDKPASVGAVIMFAGGLLIYWALSEWKLFGLGKANSSQDEITRDGSSAGGKF